MALTLKDRVLETCTAPGTGSVSLLGAVTGYQSFSSAIGNANTCYYTIADQSGANWECGIGTYTSSGNTLARTTVLSSSNGGSLTNFASGTQNVFVTYPSEKSVYLDASGNVSALGTIASGTWNASTIVTTYGGTGLSSYTVGDLPYYATGTALSKLGIGTSGYFLSSSGSAPQWTQTLGVANGGTGLNTLATGSLTYGQGTSPFASLAIGTAGQILTVNSGATAPQWSTLSGVAVTTFQTSLGGLTPSTATSGAVTLAGTLNTSSGGTGLATYTAGDLPYYASGTALSKLGIGTSGYILSSSGTAPQWVNSISIGSGTFTSVTDSGLTAGRVNYNGTGGLLVDSANLTFDGNNLGVGLTPSSWSAGKAFEIGGAGAALWNANAAGDIFLTSNTYYNSGFKYAATNAASYYEQNAGVHKWNIAPSGTAGTSVTFTQAMTLDNSGNLLVGNTSAILGNTNRGVINVNGTSTALLSLSSGASTSTAGYMYWDGSNLQVVNNSTSGALTFNTNAATERMRIDSSGNLLVGTSNQLRSGDRLSVLGSGTQVATFQQSTNTSGYSAISTIIQSNGNNTSTYHFWGNTSGVGNWYLYGNGTTSYSSDERLKKNITTARNGYIDDLCKLRVVKYNWKKDAEGTPQELGLIAQEVEKVFPKLVQDDLHPVEKDGEIYKQVKQSVLPFMLLKAIQEQQALITDLTNRIKTLENK